MTEYYRQFAFITSVLGGFAFALFGTLLLAPPSHRAASWAATISVTCLGVVFIGYARRDSWRYLFGDSTRGRVHAATDRVAGRTPFPLILSRYFTSARELWARRLGQVSMGWDRHYNHSGAWRHRGLCNFSPVYPLVTSCSRSI
jgi:hypothetical protein